MEKPFDRGHPLYDAWIALDIGSTVTIRRTSGAEQVAKVTMLARDREYLAPEVCSFEVKFQIGDKWAARGCCANDIILPKVQPAIPTF